MQGNESVDSAAKVTTNLPCIKASYLSTKSDFTLCITDHWIPLWQTLLPTNSLKLNPSPSNLRLTEHTTITKSASHASLTLTLQLISPSMWILRTPFHLTVKHMFQCWTLTLPYKAKLTYLQNDDLWNRISYLTGSRQRKVLFSWSLFWRSVNLTLYGSTALRLVHQVHHFLETSLSSLSNDSTPISNFRIPPSSEFPFPHLPRLPSAPNQ